MGKQMLHEGRWIASPTTARAATSSGELSYGGIAGMQTGDIISSVWLEQRQILFPAVIRMLPLQRSAHRANIY